MAIRIRSWWAHQSGRLNDIVTKRKRRKASGSRTSGRGIALGAITVCTDLGEENFIEFAEAVGGRRAETYLLRTLQRVAQVDPLQGVILTPREKFGRVVLSREWDAVSPSAGRKVYDALVASGIAVETRCPRGGDAVTNRSEGEGEARAGGNGGPRASPAYQKFREDIAELGLS